MKTRLIVLLALTATLASLQAAELNQLTDREKADGWRLLFDGVSTKGWRGYKKDSFPATGWKVENGLLQKVAAEPGIDVITEEKFDDFEFQWEWRIQAKGNNGVKYLVTEERPGAPGPEYQMLDDMDNPDAKVGAKRTTASFYDVLPPSADKKLNKPGEWNSSRLLIQGNHVEHWLNGDKVLEYELGSAAVLAAVQQSKFKNAKGFGTKIKGHLLLTDHKADCWFRNLKIRELPAKGTLRG